MKVCFIDWFAYGLFNPDSKIVFGGAQIQLYFLARELAKAKQFSVSFLTDNQSSSRQEMTGKVMVHQFIRSPKMPGFYGRLVNVTGYCHFFIRLLVQLRRINADIHLQRAASAETGLIALICRIYYKKFIYMVAHEQDVNGEFIKQNNWRGRLFWLGLILADKIICQTKDQQKQLSGGLRVKSVIVPPAYPIKARPCRKSINKQGILWVARAETWKNPELFLDLAVHFPKEKFTMICPPAENNPDYFKIIKTRADQIPNLEFISRVPFSQINTFFKNAKVFVSTSLSEGFPNTFIQAGKNSTPIISYQINPDKIIDRYQLGGCANGSRVQMVKFLKKVLTDNRLWRELADNALAYVSQNHNLQKNMPKLIKILRPDKRFSKSPAVV